jgi:hypothetical protein
VLQLDGQILLHSLTSSKTTFSDRCALCAAVPRLQGLFDNVGPGSAKMGTCIAFDAALRLIANPFDVAGAE